MRSSAVSFGSESACPLSDPQTKYPISQFNSLCPVLFFLDADPLGIAPRFRGATTTLILAVRLQQGDFLDRIPVGTDDDTLSPTPFFIGRG